MNLQLKLFLPTFLLFASLATTMHFYWIPNYKALETSHQLEAEQSFIEVLSIALVPDLLNNDLAKTHNTLGIILADRQHWRAITLYDDNNRILFPLEPEKSIIPNGMEKITHVIQFNDFEIARIAVWIDIQAAQAEEVEHLYQLEILLLTILLAAALLTAWLHDRWIRQPLRQLANLASDIALGHYDSNMNYGANDGIGKLVAAFNSMRQQVRRRETDLMNSFAQNKAVIDNAVDGIISINIKGTIESFNPAAEKVFGYTADEVIGKNIKLLMPQPYQREHDGYLYNYLSTGKKKIIGIGREVEGLRKDGTTFPLELGVSEVKLDDRRLFIGIIRDISERKKIDRMKSEFVSTVSHELRTPLTSIRGALSLVLGKGAKDIPPKLLRLLETANRNSERLTFLINDILDLEKISAGQLDLKLQAVNLVVLAKRAVEENDAYAHSHQIKLTLQATGQQNTRVYIDEYRLLQVFANLISNAVKFSAKGDTVTVDVKCIDNKMRVSVIDQGPGISDEFRSRIFGRFAQADSSDTREKGGTGLGLTISKAIIEQLGGHIDFNSVLGEGSQFFFELPLSGISSVNDPMDTSRATILICEDDPDLAQIMAQVLEKEGYHADIAHSAASARTLLENKSYQLLLLDLILPDGNGLDLIRELRENKATKSLAIIVISGKADEELKKFKGDALMVVDWLQKPIDFKHLSNTLAKTTQLDHRSHILHVEDNIDVIEVSQALFEDIVDFDFATTLSQALSKLNTQHYDLVILDISLPDGSGLELLNHIDHNCPVVIFSGQESSEEISKKVSASLTKSISSNEALLSTVQRLLNANK
ncbi:MAG: response regulator [Cycloclasticus sp.]|nr:response regulator [Cycloclasticus sp.]MBQ0789164.1 response regulator [Cycloclasticus sp.]